jgi:hypothetical protein
MFHVPPAMVNAGLVQLPVCWTSGTSTVAGPTAAGAAVVAAVVAVDAEDPPAKVVLVEPLADVVLVLPAAVVLVAEPDPLFVAEPAAVVAVVPLGGGSLPSALEPPPLASVADPPVLPLIHMPSTAATSTADSSCQVFQVRRSLIFSSPFSGECSVGASGSV